MDPYLGTWHWLSLSLQLILILIGVSCGQENNDDLINFGDLDVDWDAYPKCLADCFLRCSRTFFCQDITAGCATNKCLCSPAKWKEAQGRARSCAVLECPYISGDPDTAEELFIQYCQMKGYELSGSKSTSRRSARFTTSASKTTNLAVPTVPFSDTFSDALNSEQISSSIYEPTVRLTEVSTTTVVPNKTETSSDAGTSTGGDGSGDGKDGFSKGEIAGIVVGIVSALATIIAVLDQMRRRRKAAVGAHAS
ncbi:hypothetical protein BDZ91DRAFT_778027 [Kalaharituber pfeilii]|nr:hypothetical protein BDZ91DRAFT_778027 [Kalaharituber pfeilii]